MKTVFLSLLAFASIATAQDAFNRHEVRARLLDFKTNPPAQRLVIQNSPANPAEAKFLRYFSEHVFPKLDELNRLIYRYRATRILVDAALYDTPAEKEAWTGKSGDMVKLMAEYSKWSVDPEWTKILKTWGELASDLKGGLPDMARQLSRERDLESFPESAKPMLDEADQLENEYMLAINEAPAGKTLSGYTSEILAVRRKFKAGEISFAEAQQEIARLMKTGRGSAVIGHQAVQKAGENLNRVAVIRSELAKMKGFPTWAAYMLELSGQGYEPAYRGASNQREFLTQYIRALRPLHDAFLNSRIHDLGLDGVRATFRQQHLSLLTLPDIAQLQPYFPKEQLLDIWTGALFSSGFNQEDLDQIVVDAFPRDSKNPTSAYLSGFTGPYMEEVTVDGVSLNWVQEPKGSPRLRPGFAYILQNFKGMGLLDLSTAFHEGGHALEKMFKRKLAYTDEAYGYVEVPSTTSEYFTRDVDLLFNSAVEANGNRPTRQDIETLVRNTEKNEITEHLYKAGMALFDLNLWDYDYSQPNAQTYLERVEQLNKEIAALEGQFPNEVGSAPLHLSLLTTSHFISGSVRNIGYTYAEIASQMIIKHFSDELERRTGRRSWYNQPELASLFIEQLFEVGWQKPFPSNIEAITGEKFDPGRVIREMAKTLGLDCEERLQ